MEAFHELKIPFVLLMHEIASFYPDWYIRDIYQWASHIVFPAELVKNSFEKILKKQVDHCSVYPQGYPCRELTIDAISGSRRKVRDELEVPDEAGLFLGCGTVEPRKGCDYFIDIAHYFFAMKPAKPFFFIWIGDPLEPRERSAYMKALDGKISDDLRRNIRFVGSRSNIDSYFQAADVFILPSRGDPFPYVVMHAMEAAIPVICFQGTTGAENLFSDGQAGFVVEKFKAQKAAEKLMLYAENEELRRDAGKRSRQLLMERFKYGDYAQGVLSLCVNLNNQGSASE
jgi:glycosyltransferase involved in cell wall biosynthesis